MATPQQWGTGGLTVEGQLTTFDKELLARFRATTIYNRFGMQKKIPARGGKSISFRRQEAILGASYAIVYASSNLNSGFPGVGFASGPLALTEGTPGAAIDGTFIQVLASIAQYGMWIEYTDMAAEQSIDDIMAETTKNFSEAMTEALDLVTRDVMVAGTQVQYASTAVSRVTVGSGMNLTLAELREASRTLRKQNAKMIGGEGGNKYVVLTHTDCMSDLQGDANIVTIWEMAGPRGMDGNQLFDAAFADLPFGFRIFDSSLSRIFASAGLSGADVYATMVIGDQFYATVDLSSMPARIITHGFGESGISDPLDQLATIGWKAAHTSAILNQTLGVRIESNSTAKQAA